MSCSRSTAGIRTHILLLIPELESGKLDRSATTLHLRITVIALLLLLQAHLEALFVLLFCIVCCDGWINNTNNNNNRLLEHHSKGFHWIKRCVEDLTSRLVRGTRYSYQPRSKLNLRETNTAAARPVSGVIHEPQSVKSDLEAIIAPTWIIDADDIIKAR